MRRFLALPVLLSLLSAIPGPVDADSTAEKYWPQWRGPLATGVAPHAHPPIEWSEEKNISWKVEIPGKGAASPIVWGDKIFLLTAVPVGDSTRSPRKQQFTILALHRQDGTLAWKRVLREEVPHEGTHATSTWASPSPITDGEHVYAFFGSYGLYCLDMDGHLVWEIDLGDMQTRRAFGEGSSPTLHEETIVVNWDHEGDSFIVALDKNTGKEIWRQDRDEITSWSTPLVIERGDHDQVIVSATGKVRSYRLEDGDVLWEIGGMTVNVIPTPLYQDGVVLVTSGFRGNALLAIQLEGARGDLSGTDSILWSLDRDTPYTPTPLLYGSQIYLLKTNDGILSSYDFKTGEKHFGPIRLDKIKNVYASPVGAAERLYIAGRDGTTLVLENGPEYKVLAVNELDDGFDASPALVDGEIYLRGRRHLYRISEAN